VRHCRHIIVGAALAAPRPGSNQEAGQRTYPRGGGDLGEESELWWSGHCVAVPNALLDPQQLARAAAKARRDACRPPKPAGNQRVGVWGLIREEGGR
jgi:hypothetical protein